MEEDFYSMQKETFWQLDPSKKEMDSAGKM